MQLDPSMLERVRRHPDYAAPTLTTIGRPIRLYAQVSPWQRMVKRGFDIVFSAIALIIYGLLFPLIALAIKLDSRGPIFYTQVRVGINRRDRDRREQSAPTPEDSRRSPDHSNDRRKVVAEGRPFPIVKLRTMYVNAESDGVRWAQKQDPRITRVGRLLRLTRLDECPQFWNVLKGDMSVVGPRPERPPFITLLSDEVPGYLDRLRFKPGITGLAQVELGYDTSVESVHRKVACDLEYITNFSLRRDVRILFETVRVVLTGQGAF